MHILHIMFLYLCIIYYIVCFKSETKKFPALLYIWRNWWKTKKDLKNQHCLKTGIRKRERKKKDMCTKCLFWYPYVVTMIRYWNVMFIIFLLLVVWEKEEILKGYFLFFCFSCQIFLLGFSFPLRIGALLDFYYFFHTCCL